LENIIECIVVWIYRHETLTTGILALIAAFATVCVVRCQIQQTERLHKVELKRRHSAARAVLPLVLSQICGYATASITYAMALRDTKFPGPVPIVSNDAINVLRDVIETADEEIAASFRSLLSQLQVQAAMLRDLAPFQGKLVEFDFEESVLDVILDSTRLYVHVSNFFDYSRFENDSVPLDSSDHQVENRLNFLGLNKDAEPVLWQRFQNDV